MLFSKYRARASKGKMIKDESAHKGFKAETEDFNEQNRIFDQEIKKIIHYRDYKGENPLSEIDCEANEIAEFMIYAIGHGLTTEEIIYFHKEIGKEEMSERTQDIEDKLVALSEDLISDLKSMNSKEERTKYLDEVYAEFLASMESESKKMAFVMANGTGEERNALTSSLKGVQITNTGMDRLTCAH